MWDIGNHAVFIYDGPKLQDIETGRLISCPLTKGAVYRVYDVKVGAGNRTLLMLEEHRQWFNCTMFRPMRFSGLETLNRLLIKTPELVS